MNARLLKLPWNFSTILIINHSVLFIVDFFCLCIRTLLSVSKSVHIIDTHSFEPQLPGDGSFLKVTYEKLSFISCNIISSSTVSPQSEHLEWGLGFQKWQSSQVHYLYSYTHFHLNTWVSFGLQKTWNFKIICCSTLSMYAVLPSQGPCCWRM